MLQDWAAAPWLTGRRKKQRSAETSHRFHWLQQEDPSPHDTGAAKVGRAKGDFQGTVLIADDHVVLRMGLAQLLQQRLKVKRFLEATSFAEAIEYLKQEDVTLAIVDLGMPGLATPKDITKMRFLRPDALVVVLSASDRREDILEALSAGVHGYIVKSQETDHLIDRLRYILSGEIYVPPILAEHANRSSRSEERPLTSRQRQVLEG